MQKFFSILLLSSFLFFRVSMNALDQNQHKDYTAYVNPFIGSGSVESLCLSGSNIHGACEPFGILQLSPDLYDFLFMPYRGEIKWNTGSDDNLIKGNLSTYRHSNESATPGYYSVILEKYTIKAEMTATEHCGQMSAWYIFSAMGFYPVNPANGVYCLGSPQLEKAVIHLAEGKEFTILTHNAGADNVFIQRTCAI